MRIAIVDDNEALAKGIAWRLQDRGHATDVLHDGMAAAEFLRRDANDLLILDITLPGMSGLDILRGMRARGDTRPVLLLTARAETRDRVSGLDAGADDYLVKPFEMDELEARVRALARRLPQAPQTEWRLGDLRFVFETRQVEIGGQDAGLPRREVAVLEALLRARGAVISKADLLDHVYGTGADVGDTAVEAHVSRLRKKLARAGLDIRVQRGLGYTLQERT